MKKNLAMVFVVGFFCSSEASGLEFSCEMDLKIAEIVGREY